jgi:hypothetical protein
MSELRSKYLPSEVSDIEAGYEMSLDNNGIWHVAPVIERPRMMGHEKNLRLVLPGPKGGAE